MARGFRERPSDRLSGFHGQVLDRLTHHPVGLVGWQLATNDFELLLDQVGQDLGHLLTATAAKELLLRRVPVAKGDREPEPLKLGQIAEDRALADLQSLGQVSGSYARTGGRHGQDDQ